jgi:cell division protein FtsB
MADRPDALLKEKATIQRKIEEIKQQIIQLETNMQFFSENSSDNPIVIKVNQDIKKHRETLEKLEEKKKMLKSS